MNVFVFVLIIIIFRFLLSDTNLANGMPKMDEPAAYLVKFNIVKMGFNAL